jgi:hypothetical protein
MHRRLCGGAPSIPALLLQMKQSALQMKQALSEHNSSVPARIQERQMAG